MYTKSSYNQDITKTIFMVPSYEALGTNHEVIVHLEINGEMN